MSHLVAHRGWRAKYPENTLLALQHAFDVGARFVEFDVQFSRDLVPMVFHDADLERTTGIKKGFFSATSDALAGISVNETKRLGHSLPKAPIPTLTEALDWLHQHPGVTAFIEIKWQSVDQFGLDATMEPLLNSLSSCHSQCILISSKREVIAWFQHNASIPVGWVLRYYDEPSRRVAERLKPDFMICDYRKILSADRSCNANPWPGPWQWMLYEINDIECALKYAEQGINYIETGDVGGLIRHPAFRSSTPQVITNQGLPT